MSSDRLLQNAKFICALGPDADRFNGSPATDIINMRDYKHCTFSLYIGVGAAGTATITIESCDDVSATTSTAIAFRYKIVAAGGDTEADTANATSAGLLTTAGSNQQYVVEIDDSELSGTDQYVRMQLTEDDSTAVDAGVWCVLTGPKWGGNDLRTAIV